MAGTAGAGEAATDLRAAAREAALWGLPLLEFAQIRARTLGAGLPPNCFNHVRALSDHTSRLVTTPNNDTLYSIAFLDLRTGPVTVTTPATGDRYFSLALMDAYTNNFAVLGTRTTGQEGGRFTFVGPGGEATESAVRSPTPWVWALGRTLVDGPDDLAAAHEIQNGLSLAGPSSGPPPYRPKVRRDGSALALLTAIRALAAENPPPAEDSAVLARIRPVLIDYETARVTREAVEQINAGVDEARSLLARAGLGGAAGAVDGWSYPRPGLGDFGQDHLYRAAIAVNGLGALPLEEAMYMRPVSAEGHASLPPGTARRLRFEAGRLPPLREPGGFWSLTMYEVDEGGQLWLTDNPIRRFAIGDRTPGLRRTPDGALELLLSPDDPGESDRSNWLPAPRTPWTVVMRAYLPRPEMLDGRWRLPPLTPA